MSIPDDLTISYSIRDLLARIEERQVRFDEKSVQQSENFRQEIAKAEDRIFVEINELRKTTSRHEARWNRMLGVSIGVATVGGGTAGWVSAVLGPVS